MARRGRLVIKPDRCTGCRTCELACAFVHSTGGLLGLSRIRIREAGAGPEGDRHLQMTCLQCIEAACVKVCPVDALVRNEDTGAIEVSERCIGCGLCAVVCPFGHMHFDRMLGRPIKCDLCGGAPTCAAFCPHGALEVR
ncbi:MAG: 4Fe-4S dicluster domain-containing protein [Deltaproteobacteria bacterium]|nr:4Fe-4S dicluster domain-containing protein [Deltaproteobacteria bacterium]